MGASLLHVSSGRFRLGASVSNLLRRDLGGFDLRLPLNDQAARFSDLLFSRNNSGAVGFHCLGSRSGFRFAPVIVGPRDLVLFPHPLIPNPVPFSPIPPASFLP